MTSAGENLFFESHVFIPQRSMQISPNPYIYIDYYSL